MIEQDGSDLEVPNKIDAPELLYDSDTTEPYSQKFSERMFLLSGLIIGFVFGYLVGVH